MKSSLNLCASISILLRAFFLLSSNSQLPASWRYNDQSILVVWLKVFWWSLGLLQHYFFYNNISSIVQLYLSLVEALETMGGLHWKILTASCRPFFLFRMIYRIYFHYFRKYARWFNSLIRIEEAMRFTIASSNCRLVLLYRSMKMWGEIQIDKLILDLANDR